MITNLAYFAGYLFLNDKFKPFFQDLEAKMTQEDNTFRLVKETFEATEGKNLIKQESREKMRRKVDDLNSRWEEMWRAHDVNKDRYVSHGLCYATIFFLCEVYFDIEWQIYCDSYSKQK